MFNINRYYDKTSGRYIQADPIGLDGAWNRFGYVGGGNPLNVVDPEGLQATRTPLPPVSYGQTLLNIQGISLTREIQRYQPSYTYSYISGQGQGYTATNILRLQSTLFRIQQSGVCTSGNGPIAGGGAYISNITPQEILRIQNAVDRTNTTISVVGSRANGSAGPLSDWDYVVPPGTPRRTIHSMSSSLPEGYRSIGERRNQDFLILQSILICRISHLIQGNEMSNFAEVLAESGNLAVVSLSERKFPGIMIQGDTFHSIIRRLYLISDMARDSNPDLIEEIDFLKLDLKMIEDFYVKIIGDKGIKNHILE